MSADPRVALKNLAAHQLPEFVQSEYPTFVAFVLIGTSSKHSAVPDVFVIEEVPDEVVVVPVSVPPPSLVTDQ